MRLDPPDRRKSAQSAQTARLAPIGLFALLYTLVLYMLYRQDLIGGRLFASVAAINLTVLLLFYGAFKTGLNQRCADPALLLPQLLMSLAIMLTVTYIERATQIALTSFILIAFSFGLARLSSRSLTLLSVASLAVYLAIIVARWQAGGSGHGFRADLLQWFMLALALPSVILVARQIQQLRQLLNTMRRQLEHYEEKCVRDELTGLYNRRRIQAELEQAKLQADMRSAPFSICLIDIDHFKDINDTHGHLAGDAILKEFSQVALGSIRDTDVLGRYGGDEFMQILHDTDVKGAVMHAERLRVHAHFLDFQPILPHRRLSLSIGVAQYQRGEKLTDLIARADAALYQAKQLGRNRVEWAQAA